MDDRDRVETLLRGWRMRFLGDHPGYTCPGPPHLLDEEVEDLCLALDSGIFDVDVSGVFKPIGLRATGCYPFVDVADGKAKYGGWFREWITHAGAVVRLHTEYGYPLGSIGLEIDIALDVLVFSDENVPLVAVEAKQPASQLDKTLAAMEAHSGEPFPFECKPAVKLTLRARVFVDVPGEPRAAVLEGGRRAGTCIRASNRLAAGVPLLHHRRPPG